MRRREGERGRVKEGGVGAEEERRGEKGRGKGRGPKCSALSVCHIVIKCERMSESESQ